MYFSYFDFSYLGPSEQFWFQYDMDRMPRETVHSTKHDRIPEDQSFSKVIENPEMI